MFRSSNNLIATYFTMWIIIINLSIRIYFKDQINYIYQISNIEVVNNFFNELLKIDVIFEHVGLKTWDMSMRLLAKGGRLVTCGATTGSNVNINLRHLFSKQQSIIGSTMSDIDSFKKVQKSMKIIKRFKNH